jgi:Sigma-70, region 4
MDREMVKRLILKIGERVLSLEGLTNPEISKMLGLSLPNVKFRIHSARLFLRDRLSDYFHEWRK